MDVGSNQSPVTAMQMYKHHKHAFTTCSIVKYWLESESRAVVRSQGSQRKVLLGNAWMMAGASLTDSGMALHVTGDECIEEHDCDIGTRHRWTVDYWIAMNEKVNTERLSYSRRVTVVIRYFRTRWYTVSWVITYSVRSSRADTPYQPSLRRALYGAYKARLWRVGKWLRK